MKSHAGTQQIEDAPTHPYLFAAFCFAQRLRCASPILFRAAALILRFFGAAGVAGFLVPSPDSRARACFN